MDSHFKRTIAGVTAMYHDVETLGCFLCDADLALQPTAVIIPLDAPQRGAVQPGENG